MQLCILKAAAVYCVLCVTTPSLCEPEKNDVCLHTARAAATASSGAGCIGPHNLAYPDMESMSGRYSSVPRAFLEPFLEPFFERRYRIIGRELPGTFVCGPFPSRFSCTRASLPLSPAPFSSIWRIGAGAENSAPNDHAALVSRHLARAEPALHVGFGRIVD
jgi:hypothetical protein